MGHTNAAYKSATQDARSARRQFMAEWRTSIEDELYDALCNHWAPKVYAMATKLAASGVGVEKLLLRRIETYVHSDEEVKQATTAPALEGGFNADFIDNLEEEVGNYVFGGNPLDVGVLAEAASDDAHRDLKDTVRRFHRCPRGKTAPPWSAPSELFHVALWLSLRCSARSRLGVGAEKVNYWNRRIRERLYDLCCAARRTRYIPLIAHCSMGYHVGHVGQAQEFQ